MDQTTPLVALSNEGEASMVWGFLRDMFSTDAGPAPGIDCGCSTVFNPATGLPMLGDSFGGVDGGGNPYGMDMHSDISRVSGGFDANPWD